MIKELEFEVQYIEKGDTYFSGPWETWSEAIAIANRYESRGKEILTINVITRKSTPMKWALARKKKRFVSSNGDSK
jgi:hypothetical protein